MFKSLIGYTCQSFSKVINSHNLKFIGEKNSISSCSAHTNDLIKRRGSALFLVRMHFFSKLNLFVCLFVLLFCRFRFFVFVFLDYLKGVKQTNTHTLPDGPVLLSPASFLASIKREVSFVVCVCVCMSL